METYHEHSVANRSMFTWRLTCHAPPKTIRHEKCHFVSSVLKPASSFMNDDVPVDSLRSKATSHSTSRNCWWNIHRRKTSCRLSWNWFWNRWVTHRWKSPVFKLLGSSKQIGGNIHGKTLKTGIEELKCKIRIKSMSSVFLWGDSVNQKEWIQIKTSNTLWI